MKGRRKMAPRHDRPLNFIHQLRDKSLILLQKICMICDRVAKLRGAD